MLETLTILIHGESGVGKSTVADRSPEPRLTLDAEGGNKFTTSRKIIWDPMMYAPPVYDGTWDTCVVQVRDFRTLQKVYDTLQGGQHPFRTVILDSLTEIQKRCMDALVGIAGMDQQDWGALLRQMEYLVRQYRDLTMHPTNPISCVAFLALTSEKKGKYRAHVQGQLGVTLPGYVDVVGYQYTRVSAEGNIVHELLLHPHPQFDAKDRTRRLPQVLSLPPDESVGLSDMMAMIFGHQQAPPSVSPASVPVPAAPEPPAVAPTAGA